MCCCSRRQRTGGASAPPPAPELPGSEEGLVALRYEGVKPLGPWFGPVSGLSYQFGHGFRRVAYVDARDVEPLLELRENGSAPFVRCESLEKCLQDGEDRLP